MVHRLLTGVASPVVEHGLWVPRLQELLHVGSEVAACRLQSTGSVVVVKGLLCSEACGILGHGLNWCPLHCKADS